MKKALYIKTKKQKGRCVFSNYSIDAGTLFESCAAILIYDEAEKQILKNTLLNDYLFYWDTEKTISAIALGFGSLYNHSLQPNAYYLMNNDTKTIDFYSLSNIRAHEEITINYNGGADKNSLEWFTLRGIPYFE